MAAAGRTAGYAIGEERTSPWLEAIAGIRQRPYPRLGSPDRHPGISSGWAPSRLPGPVTRYVQVSLSSSSRTPPEVMNQAEAILATQAADAAVVEGVLLSTDLAPHVLALLQLEDSAAAAVCSLWAEGWKATSEGRRRLKRVAFDFPLELLVNLKNMAVIPGDDEQLVVNSGHMVDILDRSLSTVTSFMDDEPSSAITADEQSIYCCDSVEHGILRKMSKMTHFGTEITYYGDPCADQDDAGCMYCPVRAPGGLLFCVRYEMAVDDEYEQNNHYELDEIIALDAHSMQLRFRFGKSLFNDARGLAVVGEELFVCDMRNDRLQVFSLAGEHRRSITGEWKRPASLCVMKDRMYLVENYDLKEDGPYEDRQARGRRIFVLSLQGDTLQVYPIPAREGCEGNRFSLENGCPRLVCFDGKLLVPYADNSHTRFEMVALA